MEEIINIMKELVDFMRLDKDFLVELCAKRKFPPDFSEN